MYLLLSSIYMTTPARPNQTFLRQSAYLPARAGGNFGLRELAHQFPLDPCVLRSPDRSQSVSFARAVLSFVLVRRLGYRVADVAAALGRDGATVSLIVSRLAGRLESSDRMAADVARLSRNV